MCSPCSPRSSRRSDSASAAAPSSWASGLASLRPPSAIAARRRRRVGRRRSGRARGDSRPVRLRAQLACRQGSSSAGARTCARLPPPSPAGEASSSPGRVHRQNERLRRRPRPLPAHGRLHRLRRPVPDRERRRAGRGPGCADGHQPLAATAHPPPGGASRTAARRHRWCRHRREVEDAALGDELEIAFQPGLAARDAKHRLDYALTLPGRIAQADAGR